MGGAIGGMPAPFEPRRRSPRRRPRPDSSVDQALAEIEARQRMLDGGAAPRRRWICRAPRPRACPTSSSSSARSTPASTTCGPAAIDAAVETLRDDLAEIGMMLKEAMPRQAIEALESEIRSLAVADRQRTPCRRRWRGDGARRARPRRNPRRAARAHPRGKPGRVQRDAPGPVAEDRPRRQRRPGPGGAQAARGRDRRAARRGFACRVERRAGAIVRRGARALRQGRPGHADRRCVLDDGAADRGDRRRVAGVARRAGRRCRRSRNGGAEPRRQGRSAPRHPLRPDRGQLSRRPDHAAGREARRLRRRASTISARSSAGSPTC